MNKFKASSKEYWHIVVAMFLAGLATFNALYFCQALLVTFSQIFAISPAIASLAVSLTTGFLAFALIPASYLTPYLGKEKIMQYSLLGTTTLGFILLISPNIYTLLIIRALQGIFIAGIPATAMAFLADKIDHRDLPTAMGIYVAGTSIGGLTGRTVTAVALDYLDWKVAIFITVSVIALCTVLFLYLLKQIPAPTAQNPHISRFNINTQMKILRQELHNRPLLLILCSGFLLMGGFVSLYNYAGYYLMQSSFKLTEKEIGLIFLCYLAGTLSSSLIGQAIKRTHRLLLITLSTLLVAMIGASLTSLQTLPLVILGILLFTGGFFALHTILSYLVTSVSQHKTSASSLYLLCYYAGSGLLGTLLGIVFFHYQWPGTIITIEGLYALSGLLILCIFYHLWQKK